MYEKEITREINQKNIIFIFTYDKVSIGDMSFALKGDNRPFDAIADDLEVALGLSSDIKISLGVLGYEYIRDGVREIHSQYSNGHGYARCDAGWGACRRGE